MPTPLPSVDVPDFAQTLNAYRTGTQDRIAADERNVLKEAGGLAAAGNYKGAQSALYRGGNFGEARSVAGELRAQSAEGRAQGTYARTMANDKLEQTGKMYELFGRLTEQIKTPEQLEMAKQLIKQRTGHDFSSVTMEQLPMLHQQGISTQQQIENELSERRMKAEQLRADQAQSNSNRSFGLQEKQFDNTVQNQTDIRDIMRMRAKAAADKAGAAKPLTSEQAKAQAYELELSSANKAVKDSLVDRRGGGMLSGPAKNRLGEYGESPLSSTTNQMALSDYTPGFVTANYLNKSERQYLQQAEQFLSVLLYHRSGAQISAPEFARSYRIYFPQPGDDLQTRRYKAEARKTAIKGIQIQGAMTPNAPAGAPNAPNAPNAGEDWSDIKILSEE
jgi:hypothetical protein